jgi:hypothetical protein
MASLRAEAFDDVVMPPDDLGQLINLDRMLHGTSSATLRGAGGEEMLLPSEVYEVLLEVVTAMSSFSKAEKFPLNSHHVIVGSF